MGENGQIIDPDINIVYFNSENNGVNSHYYRLFYNAENFLYGTASAYSFDADGDGQKVSPKRFDITGFSDSPITTGDTYSDWCNLMQINQIKERVENSGNELFDRYCFQTQWGPAVYREGIRLYDNMKICQMDVYGEETWCIRAYTDEFGVIVDWAFFY